jgi:poly(3-hydroxybutyrate) depolymerase
MSRQRRSVLSLQLAFIFIVLLGNMPRSVQAADTTAAPDLPSFQVDLNQTSVSGLSSGAFMAGQFAVAYSSIVVGAGIVAGGPFYCAGYPGIFGYTPYAVNAVSSCMNPANSYAMPPSASASWMAAKTFERLGDIDATSNLSRQRIYLFSGKNDQTVTTQVVQETNRFYALAGVPAQNIKFITTVNAGHAIITKLRADLGCPTTASPYINDCGFTQANDILSFIYPNLKPASTKLSGKIISFNQAAFASPAASSMSNTGYAYVPQACNTQSCRVHVAFHGCQQGADQIGNLFYTTTGYNEVADANNIIVLYPQVTTSQTVPMNPQGCWDFWGYTSPFSPTMPSFYKKSAIQMEAVKDMLDRLAAPRGAGQALQAQANAVSN